MPFSAAIFWAAGITGGFEEDGVAAAGIVQLLVVAHVLAEVVRRLVPRALVLRLFLAPHHFAGVGVALHLRLELLVRERIELLDADDGHVAALGFDALGGQVVVDLAAASDDA